MKQKSLIILFVSFFLVSSLFTETVTWNCQNNFDNKVYKTTNTEFIKSGATPLFYKIKKNSVFDGNDTDLYLPFDKGTGSIDSNYRYIYSKFQYRESNPYINTSGFFFKEDQRIELEGNKGTIFTPGRSIGSFFIGFQIFPLTFSSNESIFNIGTHYYNEETESVEDQSISCLLDEGFIKIRFNNVLSLNGKSVRNFVEINSYIRVNAMQWSGVSFSYDCFSGIAKIFVNGKESGIAMLTEDGSNDTSVLDIFFNSKNRCILSIASDYTGAIDEFIIKKTDKNNMHDQYLPTGGEIVSNVIKLDEFPIVLRSVEFDESSVGVNDIVRYSVRYSNEPFYPDENISVKGKIPWVEFNDSYISGRSAKYIQWKALLLPGGGGALSPKFKGITVKYDKNLPPAVPVGIQAVSVKGEIRLKWHLNSEIDLKGYKIYYGRGSNDFFCNDALQGESPIKIEKTDTAKLTGLKNNVVYYIRISAFDDKEGKHESDFSDEVSLRFYE